MTLLTENKPGQFKAVCRKPGLWEAAPTALVEEWRDHLVMSVPYNRGAEAIEAYRVEKARLEEALSPWSEFKNGEHGRHIACDFETTDREAYVEHMRTLHGARFSNGENWPWASTIKPRRPLRLPAEGKPFKASSKPTAETVRTCDGCGLVAEVSGTAGELWWDEHQRGCAIARAAS